LIISLLHGIREGFGIDIWLRLSKEGIEIVERSPIDRSIRVLKCCHTLDAVATFLTDLMTCEGVFSS